MCRICRITTLKVQANNSMDFMLCRVNPIPDFMLVLLAHTHLYVLASVKGDRFSILSHLLTPYPQHCKPRWPQEHPGPWGTRYVIEETPELNSKFKDTRASTWVFKYFRESTWQRSIFFIRQIAKASSNKARIYTSILECPSWITEWMAFIQRGMSSIYALRLTIMNIR